MPPGGGDKIEKEENACPHCKDGPQKGRADLHSQGPEGFGDEFPPLWPPVTLNASCDA